MVRRLAEEAGASAAELPDTVQALLAARLDSLEPFERRLVAARGGRRPDVLGGRAGAASPPPRAATSTQALARAAREGHRSSPARRARARGRARARVQARADPRRRLRDAAQGRARRASTSRSASSSRTRAGERIDEVVALLAEHYGRAAHARRRRRSSTPPSASRSHEGACATSRPPATPPRVLLEPRGLAHYEAALRAGHGEDADAVARISEKQGDVALRLGRVDRAIEVWEEALEYHRSARGPRARRRAAPQDRRRRCAHKRRAQAGDRAPPAGHQPAQGRRAVARARAPLRGGGVAVHADRRQHARDLRLREGAAAGRAPRRGRARRAARTASSAACSGASATRRRRARTSSARSSSRAAPTQPRDDPRAARARPPPRELEGDYDRRRARLRRGARAGRSRSATCRREVELHAARRAARLLPRRLGAPCSAPATPAPSWPSARAWSASCACRYALRGLAALARGRLGRRPSELFRRAHELAEQVGWSEVVLRRAVRPRGDAARPRGHCRGARGGARAGARGVRARRPDRAVDPGERRRARSCWPPAAEPDDARARRRSEAAELAERVHYPLGEAAALEAAGRDGRRRRGRRPSCARRRGARGRRSGACSTPPAASCSPGRALLEVDPRRGAGCARRTRGPPSSELGVAHLAARARELAAG